MNQRVLDRCPSTAGDHIRLRVAEGTDSSIKHKQMAGGIYCARQIVSGHNDADAIVG